MYYGVRWRMLANLVLEAPTPTPTAGRQHLSFLCRGKMTSRCNHFYGIHTISDNGDVLVSIGIGMASNS